MGDHRALPAAPGQLGAQGSTAAPGIRLFGGPCTSWLVLIFLAGVLVLIGLDYPVGIFTIGSLGFLIPLLVIGWFACRDRIAAIAEQRSSVTGAYPIVAGRPYTELHRQDGDGEAPAN